MQAEPPALVPPGELMELSWALCRREAPGVWVGIVLRSLHFRRARGRLAWKVRGGAAGGWEGTKGISNWKFCNREPCA